MSFVNNQGNNVTLTTYLVRDRSFYDSKMCNGPKWELMPSPQDSAFYGVWVNKFDKIVVTFVEGDEFVVRCKTDKQFQDELMAIERFNLTC